MRIAVKVVRVLALLCIAALLFAAIAAVPGLDFALLAVLVFIPVARGLWRRHIAGDGDPFPLSPHPTPSRPRSPPFFPIV